MSMPGKKEKLHRVPEWIPCPSPTEHARERNNLLSHLSSLVHSRYIYSLLYEGMMLGGGEGVGFCLRYRHNRRACSSRFTNHVLIKSARR